MNARELHDKLEYEHKAGLRWLFSSDAQERETILRALRLLAAAEANDGNCPETEAAMCRYTGGEPVTFPKGLSAVVPYSFAANLERERNGLAARVRELEAKVRLLNIFKGCAMDAIEAHEITNQGDHDVIGALIGIDARSK